jgi:hypothetical protein
MIEMATGRRFSSASSNTSANPPGNSSSSSSSSSSLSTSLRDGVVIVDIGNNSSNNNNNNNNNNTCNNRFVGGLSRMKRFQILLWVTMVFTFFHLRRNLPNVSPPQIEKKNSNKSTKISPAITTATVVTTSPPPTSSPLMKPTSTTATTTPTATSDKSSIDSSTIMTTATDVETIIVEKEDEYIDDHRETQKPNIDNNDIANNDSDSDSEKQQPTTMTPQPSSPPIQVPQIINSEESSTDNKPSKKDENGVDAIKTTETASKAPILTNSSSSSSSTLPKVRTDNDLTPIERKFADTHCDLTHLKNNEWYPSSLSEEDGDDDSWQQRAPYIIIAGVWNAGINPIANALFTHPQIDKAKTNGFFLPKQFQRYYDVGSNNDVNNNNDNDNNNNNNNSTSTTEIASSSSSPSFNIKVFAARERMYAQVYSKSTLREKAVNDEESKDILGRGEDNNDNKNNHVAMDVSPGLIFYAHRTAHSILCTVPWVKIVIVLRNPIDRLYQQWSYSTNNLGLTLSLEDWMAQEMKLLHTVGLIGASTSNSDVNNNKNKNNINDKDKDSVLTVVSEKEAWEKYQSVRNVAGAMGRSLYVLQLEEWINAYIAAGKNPSDFITILTTENIEDQPQKEYNKLIQFLHLAPITENNNDIDDKNNIASTLLEKSFNKTKNNVNKNDLTPPMKEETRNMLRHFFRPYNQRLTKLLRSNGFEGNWDERWK